MGGQQTGPVNEVLKKKGIPHQVKQVNSKQQYGKSLLQCGEICIEFKKKLGNGGGLFLSGTLALHRTESAGKVNPNSFLVRFSIRIMSR